MKRLSQEPNVTPCPYIHVSLGNFFKEPLKDIIDRGLSISFFGKYKDTCLIAEDRKFIQDYDVKKYTGDRFLSHVLKFSQKRIILKKRNGNFTAVYEQC